MIPDVLTRVSEYVPEVIDYVKKIVDNGFGLVLLYDYNVHSHKIMLVGMNQMVQYILTQQCSLNTLITLMVN